VNNEIGRELKINELKERTVVIVGKENNPNLATMWVVQVGMDFVAFYMGETNMTFLAYLREDGHLIDDSGKRILVFEYLGEV
jgi:hypothetical protein